MTIHASGVKYLIPPFSLGKGGLWVKFNLTAFLTGESDGYRRRDGKDDREEDI
jgi:hypothetical protein